jgi:hypothetical protein
MRKGNQTSNLNKKASVFQLETPETLNSLAFFTFEVKASFSNQLSSADWTLSFRVVSNLLSLAHLTTPFFGIVCF